MLIPPVNFALVVGEVYRSGHPISLNHPFLETLDLKTIVYIGDSAPEEVASEYNQWAQKNGIQFRQIPMASVKEPTIETDPRAVEEAMRLILDKRNHPILVHSDKGKHRVGVVMASVRKCFQMWALAPTYEEYIRFAKGKADSDFLFIEQFRPQHLDSVPRDVLPRWACAYRNFMEDQ